jgi:hypothetical protein
MATKTKLENFFEKRRCEVRLQKWEHLRSGEPEAVERIKMHLSMPLLNHDITGIHKLILSAYEPLQKDDCAVGRSKLEVALDGMTVRIFNLPLEPQLKLDASDEAPEFSISGAKFDNFALVCAGVKDKRTVDLAFTLYLQGTKKLMNYSWDHNHRTFWIDAEYSQSELDFKGDKADKSDDEEEEEGDDPDPTETREPVAVATAPKPAAGQKQIPTKSGPKDLALYHQRQIGAKKPATPAKKAAKKK